MASTVSGVLLTGNHASRPSSGVTAGTLYSCTTHSLVYQTSDTGSTWATWATLGASGAYTPGGTDVAIADGGTGASTASAGFNALSPMTTAGDIIYGGASGAGTRLALGAAGGAVSRVNGAVAWNSGTSFPSAATGDRYWRTDLRAEFTYDGTRWVSSTLYNDPFGPGDVVLPLTATGTSHRMGPGFAGVSSIYLDTLYLGFIVIGGTALSASHKWVITMLESAGATTLATITIDSGSLNVWRNATPVSIGAVSGTTVFEFDINATKTGTPGSLYLVPRLLWRWIVT